MYFILQQEGECIVDDLCAIENVYVPVSVGIQVTYDFLPIRGIVIDTTVRCGIIKFIIRSFYLNLLKYSK